MAEILSSLGIHWSSFVAQAVNFGILAFVLWKFVIKGALASLDERVKKQEAIEQNSKNIENRLLDIEESKKAILEEARKESRKIIEESERSSVLVASKIKQEADLSAKKILDEAKLSMENEKKLIVSEIKKELFSIVSLGIETTALKKLGAKDKEDIAKESAEEALRLYEVKNK